jgi:hypothetical protein
MNRAELDLFRESCGVSGPLELDVLRAGEDVAERRSFELPFALMRRPPRREDAGRCRAYLQAFAGKVFFLDLAVREGGRYPQGWLGPGEAVEIGTKLLRLPAPSHGAATAGHGPPATDAGHPGVTLEIDNGRGLQVRWRMNRVLVLAGRDPGCQVRLAGADVAGVHCSLLLTPLGVWVVDLLSDHGTLLNGKRVRWACLADGDRLQLGSFLVRPRYDWDGAPAPEQSTPAAQVGPTRSDIALSPPVARAPAGDARMLAVLGQVNSMQQEMFEQFHQTLLLVVQAFGDMQRQQTGSIRAELEEMRRLTREIDQLRAGRHLAGPLPTPRPGVPPDASTEDTLEQSVLGPGESPSGDPATPRPARAGDVPALEGSDGSIHVWLSRRIAMLHAERQGRWQRIVDFVMGR